MQEKNGCHSGARPALLSWQDLGSRSCYSLLYLAGQGSRLLVGMFTFFRSTPNSPRATGKKRRVTRKTRSAIHSGALPIVLPLTGSQQASARGPAADPMLLYEKSSIRSGLWSRFSFCRDPLASHVSKSIPTNARKTRNYKSRSPLTSSGARRISRHLSGSIFNPPSGIFGFYFKGSAF
jgi:hypothetical protein